MKAGTKRKHEDDDFRRLKALEIVIPRVDYETQFGLSRSCSKLRCCAERNAIARFSACLRKIKKSKNKVAAHFFNPATWQTYRALTWLTEESSRTKMRTRSSSARLRPSSFLSLVRARRVAQKIVNNGMTVYNNKKLLYKWTSPAKMAALMVGWKPNQLKIKKMYDEGCSPDWIVEANHKSVHKSCIWHLSTGHRRPRKTQFIPRDFPYRGIDAIHYYSGNWAALLISRDAPAGEVIMNQMGEDEHLLLVRLDTSQIRVIERETMVDKLQRLVAEHEWIVSNLFVNSFSVTAQLATLELEFFGRLTDAISPREIELANRLYTILIISITLDYYNRLLGTKSRTF